MTKFNVGDRVVALRDDVDVTEGKTYVVVDIDNDWEFSVVLRDDAGDWNAMREIDLELAEEYEDETVMQLRKEIDVLKAEMNGLAAQVTSLVADKPEPKPVFKEGDYVRFIAPYVDFEGDVARDGQYGSVVSIVHNPVVLTESGVRVLIDTDEVEVSDVIEHAEDSASSNDAETKGSKTVVVEYDPIEWADIKTGDVLICVGDVVDTRKGYAYLVTRIVNGHPEYLNSVGEYNYVDISEEADTFDPMRQRIIG